MLGAARKASHRRGKHYKSEGLMGFISANDLLWDFELTT